MSILVNITGFDIQPDGSLTFTVVLTESELQQVDLRQIYPNVPVSSELQAALKQVL